jgi:hypothetical protein
LLRSVKRNSDCSATGAAVRCGLFVEKADMQADPAFLEVSWAYLPRPSSTCPVMKSVLAVFRILLKNRFCSRVRNRGSQGVQAVIERQQSVFEKRNDDVLLLDR